MTFRQPTLTLKSARRKAQGGYSLVELAIIGMFLGLFSVFSIDQVSTQAAQKYEAAALWETKRKLTEGWNMVWQLCGLTPASVSTVSVGNGSGSAAVNNLALVAGLAPANASYQRCVQATGLRALAPAVLGTAAAPVGLKYPVTWAYGTVNSSKAMLISFAGVPDDVVLTVYQRYSNVSTAAAASSLLSTATDTTDSAVRFSAATSGKRTLTLIHIF